MTIGIKMLTYLKRMKVNRKNQKVRFTNVIICSMQIISAFATFVALLINLGQESAFPLIIKTYVAL